MPTTFAPLKPGCALIKIDWIYKKTNKDSKPLCYPHIEWTSRFQEQKWEVTGTHFATYLTIHLWLMRILYIPGQDDTIIHAYPSVT